MRRHKLIILVALVTLALGRVVHEPIFTTAPAAETVAISHSQNESIQPVIFPTTQDDGEWLKWLASSLPSTIDAAPAPVATTQPSNAPVAIFWTVETPSPTFAAQDNQPAFHHQNLLNDPVALVENTPASPYTGGGDIEGLSSGEGSSSQSHNENLPNVPADTTAIPGSPPPAVTLGSNPLLNQTSNNSGNSSVGTSTPAPEPSGIIMLAAIIFTTETRRARRRSKNRG